MRNEDYWHNYLTKHQHTMDNLHTACFKKCATIWDMTFLSMEEGVCYRNCVHKFGNFYARYEALSREAPYR